MRARWLLRTNAVVLAWLAAAAVVAIAHRWVPAAEWLMTHLLLLGAASTAVHIWSAHFAQALGRRPLPGGHRHQAIRLVLHTTGALAVITGLLAGDGRVVAVGATAVGAAALWHAGTLATVLSGAGPGLGLRLGWTTRYFVVAALALPVGAVLGWLLVDAGGAAAARAHLGHVTVMLLGWVGLTVVGTLVTLWPTMLRVPVTDASERAGRGGLPLLAAALITVLAGAGLGLRPLAAAGLAGYLAGVLVVLRPLLDQARRRAPDTFAARSVAAGVAWLLATVGVWAFAVALAPTWPEVQARTSALVAALAAGFTGQVLLGALSHLGPMALGGGPTAVRAARAVVERGGGARLVLVNGGLALLVLPAPSLVRVGGSMLALGAAAVTLGLLVRAAVVSRRTRAVHPGLQTVPASELLAAGRQGTRGSTVAALAALALVVVGAVGADPAAAGLGAPAGGDVTATGRVVTVEVVARDMRFHPASVTVDPGDELVIVLTNEDAVVHDLVLDTGAASGRLTEGGSARMEVGPVGRSVDGWCSVAGHRQMGMVFTVEVTGGGQVDADDGANGHGGHGHGGSDPAGPSAAADLDHMAVPDRGFSPWDPALPPASDARVHRVRLEVTESEHEVAPGVRQTLWTFGGTAPGPALRGRVGDTFEITLVNDGTIGHSIDFHAGALAPAEPMRTIDPGEELTYTFTATRAGIWMYHCSTMPMSLHIANGMFGAVIIDPPDLPAVEREYVLVQSELYLGPQGGIADAERIGAEAPDAVVFNGYANQYAHAPLPADVGERVRIWVLDAGPNRASAFHVVGGQFDTVFREGDWVLGGPDGPAVTGGAQVLALQPAEGGFVELVLPEAGQYPFVSHVMVDAERGAYGLLDAR